jgi:hypothetical protein
MVTLTSWRRVGAANAPTPAVHGQASEASGIRSKAQAPEEAVYVEVSEYEAGQAGRKRPRQDATSQQCKEVGQYTLKITRIESCLPALRSCGPYVY